MTIAPTPNLETAIAGTTTNPGATQMVIPTGAILLPGLNKIKFDVVMPAEGEYGLGVANDALQTTAL